MPREEYDHNSSNNESFKNVGHPHRSELTSKIEAGKKKKKKGVVDDAHYGQYEKCQPFYLKMMFLKRLLSSKFISMVFIAEDVFGTLMYAS